MKLFARHDTQARHPRQRGRRAILIAVAVAAAVALAWLIFNAVIRVRHPRLIPCRSGADDYSSRSSTNSDCSHNFSFNQGLLPGSSVVVSTGLVRRG